MMTATRKTQLTSMNLLRTGRVYSAYDICDHAAQQILAEPKRLYMDWFVATYKGEATVPNSEMYIGEKVLNNGPSCGTTACLAGWIGLNMRVPHQRISSPYVFAVFGVGRPSLLYDALYYLFSNMETTHRYGTKAYAAQFVKRLRAVMATFEPDLKDRRILITADGPVPQ